MVALAMIATPTRATAQTETLLHSFNDNGTDGVDPQAGVIADAAGNLYGTTRFGGAYNYGVVFELSPKPGGGWADRVLHSFNNDGVDGNTCAAGLVIDAAGNLYGTTQRGGAYTYGVVFELSPGKGGAWTEKVLHSFGNGLDGQVPMAGLVMDAAGNLYGTTQYGGARAVAGIGGTVFELSAKAGGGWVEKILHSFADNGRDGFETVTGVIFDGAGNLYGATIYGGADMTHCINGCGTVFELTPRTGEGWAESILHNFAGGNADGAGLFGGLVIDAAGNLYGTTYEGGTGMCPYGAVTCGTVFELTPAASGTWSEAMYSFDNADGFSPLAGLILDASGNLYGTTIFGGAYREGGSAFELTPTAGGGWTETLLHSFASGHDGAYPLAGLTFGPSGVLYGTASGGGAYGGGVVFEITP
jgi:uncharacterized repeat protein (TIGR03803 family)